MQPVTSDKTIENDELFSKHRFGRLAVFFSFPVMCMFILAAAIFAYCPRGIDESDIWWHMRDAETLLQHHLFLRSDAYSFTSAGSAWINFEWLSEVPYFLAYRTAGLRGILTVYFLVLALIYTGVYYRCCRQGADCKNAAIATLGAICLGGVSMAPRTLLFGWLCLVAELLILDCFRRTRRGAWLLPPLFVLWINLHGSWVFGFVILAIAIAAGTAEGECGRVVARRWSATELKRLLLVSVASFAALFANPFGYKLVLYPFDLLFRQQSVIAYLDEWQPVDFGTVNGKLAMLLIFILFATVFFSRRRWYLDEVALASFALWTALSHVRFMFFAGVILAPLLAPSLTLFPPYERELDKPWLNAIIISAIVAGMVMFFPTAAELQQRVDAKYPRAALEFMQRHHVNGRIFNQYAWGGYMEWHARNLKPGIDGRADIFVYNGVFNDFLGAAALKDSFAILDKYQIDYVLIAPKGPLAYLLNRSPAWHVIYADQISVLMERISSSH